MEVEKVVQADVHHQQRRHGVALHISLGLIIAVMEHELQELHLVPHHPDIHIARIRRFTTRQRAEDQRPLVPFVLREALDMTVRGLKAGRDVSRRLYEKPP